MKSNKVNNLENYLVKGKLVQLSTLELKRRTGYIEDVHSDWFEFKEIVNKFEFFNKKDEAIFNYHIINKDEVEDICFV